MRPQTLIRSSSEKQRFFGGFCASLIVILHFNIFNNNIITLLFLQMQIKIFSLDGIQLKFYIYKIV